MKARPLEEWSEEDGDVVWWTWDAEDQCWLGEPAYIGSPLDCGRNIAVTVDGQDFVASVCGWPGYHTHWTPHPAFPESLYEKPTLDDEKSILTRLYNGDTIAYSSDGDTAWFVEGDQAWVGDEIITMRVEGLLHRGYDDRDYISTKGVLKYIKKYEKYGGRDTEI